MCPAIEIKGRKIFRLGGLMLMWTGRERTERKERPLKPVSPEKIERGEYIRTMNAYAAKSYAEHNGMMR